MWNAANSYTASVVMLLPEVLVTSMVHSAEEKYGLLAALIHEVSKTLTVCTGAVVTTARLAFALPACPASFNEAA